MTLENVVLRRCERADVAAVVDLIGAGQLSGERDQARTPAELEPYLRAFEAIDADAAQLLVVADVGAGPIGTMQLTFIPGLARRGTSRMMIESLHVREESRGHGLGAAMITWAVGVARDRGCSIVQLTSNKARTDAHRFYQRLGFTASHEGFKLQL